MALVAQLFRSIQPILDAVYPPRCPACGDAIANQLGLCTACWSTLETPEGEAAEVSGVPVIAATHYNDTSRNLVLAFKHGGKISLSRLLARLMAARLPDAVDNAAPPLLVPVPLHRWRLWHRGFNQAALLAQDLARLGKGEALVGGLIRHKRTPSLGGLGRDARDRALAGAVSVNPDCAAMLAGRHVMLIDDVFTSGATSRACITALRKARPASITAVCFARVEGGGSHKEKQAWT